MNSPIYERDLTPAKRELLDLFLQAPEDRKPFLLAFIRALVKAEGKSIPPAAGEPNEEVSAILDEVWELADRTNEGVPVCASPHMARAAGIIAEAKRDHKDRATN